MRMRFAEDIAAGLGIAGALLLATAAHPGLGFAAFLGSNVAGMVFMARCRHWRLVAAAGERLPTDHELGASCAIAGRAAVGDRCRLDDL